MTSKITLYQNAEILPDRLFIVDSIEEYLATLTSNVIDKFQYIRHAMRVSIKVDLSQSNIDFSTTGYNYCKIQNGDGKIVYYFITNKHQVAKETIAFDLEMDTINTFLPAIDFTINEKTTINRQHKDRFQYRGIYNPNYQSVPVSTFESGFSGTLPTYYLCKTRLDPIPATAPYILIPTTVTRTLGGGLATIIIKVYSYNPNLKKMTLILSADDRESQLGIRADSSGYVYASFGTENYYPLDGEYLVIEWSAQGDFFGGYTTNCTYGNVPSSLFLGILQYVKDWYRNIDLNSEGINPVLYGEEKAFLNDANTGNRWYLVYKGETTIQALLFPEYEETIPFKAQTTITPESLTAGSYYYILPERQNGELYVIDASGNRYKIYEKGISYYSGGLHDGHKSVLCYYQDGANIKYRIMFYRNIGLGFYHTNSTEWFTTSSLKFDTALSIININILGNYTSNTATIKTGTTTSISTTSSEQIIASFSSFDRTQDDIIKIIALPYMPLLKLANGSYEKATYNSTYKCLELSSLDNDLSVDEYNSTWWNPYADLYLGTIDTSKTAKDINMESKLFHSDYYQPKVVYDSFTFVFSLERINIDECLGINGNFGFTFTCTNTINSRFLFTFNEYVTNGKMVNNYDNIMYVARNNEVTVYSSSYMSYLKNGFNYDVKSKQRSEVGTWIGFGVTAIGAIASFASGVGAGAGIVLTASASAQLVNAVNSTAQAEANQSQRLQQLRMQADSVHGADDVDLMMKYTGNIAKMMLFKVSSRLKQCLYNLFFYTGYNIGVQGIPNYTSRTRFNFVSADLDLHDIKNITNDIINDIKDKYKLGVTFIHKYDSSWNFAQDLENWETALFD